VALNSTRRERQDRIKPIQSLNGGLFIDAEHRGVLGGFRYRPIMSAALVSKSGSLLAMYRSSRCGFSPASCQTRCTASLLTPRAVASLRQLQCVEPSLGGLRVADRILPEKLASVQRTHTRGA
jgi:hypothetical protein